MKGGEDFGLGDGLEERGKRKSSSVTKTREKVDENGKRADLDSSEDLSVRRERKSLESFVSESLTSSGSDALLLPSVGVHERALGGVDDVVVELDLCEARETRERTVSSRKREKVAPKETGQTVPSARLRMTRAASAKALEASGDCERTDGRNDQLEEGGRKTKDEKELTLKT